MPTPHKIKDFWRGKGRKGTRLAAWLNQVAAWLNLCAGADGIAVDSTGPSIRITPATGYVMVPEPPATGFYVLTSTDGVLSWKLIVDCAGGGATP